MATRIVLLLLVGLAVGQPAARASAQGPPAGETLTLAEAYRLAEAHNPMLTATRARTEAVQTLESAAALPPDPQLSVGVMNASLPGLSLDMPNSMAPAIEVMQMVPLPGKLGLSDEIARHQTRIADAEADEAFWMVRTRTAMAFFEIDRADRLLETMRRTLRLLEDLEAVARARYASGEGPQADVLRAGVEVARMHAEIERMTAMRQAAVARLNGVLGRTPDSPVPAVESIEPAGTLPSTEVLRDWAEESRPLLRRSSFAVAQADARASLARRELWPDLSVGVQYGQRNTGVMGTERMGSLMLGVSVPIFARQRQLKMREEAVAMRRMAEAEAADASAQVNARIGELVAELNRTRTLTALYRAEVLPQAAAAVQSAFSSYRVGAVDFMTLVDARMTLNGYEQELHLLQTEHGQLIAELEMTVGRELPRTSQPLEEVR